MAKKAKKPELADVFKNQKKWWLTPILIIAALLIALLVLGKNPEIAPFIYERF